MFILSEDNFILFAMHHYDNVQCTSIDEFNNDLSRFKSLSRLFYRYKNYDELKERLILNHLIVLFNIFNDAATDMLFFKIDKDYWSVLSTFLVYLNRFPKRTNYTKFDTGHIELDPVVIERLRSQHRGTT
jgi:hypothetical protein